MANVLVDETALQDIADAIRAKNGTQNTYKPGQMADAIEAIPSGGITPTGAVNINSNGTHDVTQYASANVNVPTGITPTGTKQISIIQNGTVTEDVTNYASAEIAVNVSGGARISQTEVEILTGNSGTVPRAYDNFIFIAEVVEDELPESAPSTNSAVFMMFAYVNGNFVNKNSNRGYDVTTNNATTPYTGGASNMVRTSVDDTSITFSTYTSHNMYHGTWKVTQIELPASLGIYSFADKAFT